jgi:phosphoglycolate phosphatase-like HAD superfamily hydrolase
MADRSRSVRRVPVFDLDGTLLDSDRAVIEPLVRLGARREDILIGEPVVAACRRLGVDLDAYVEAYDPAEAGPFPGVPELVAALGVWAVCSNKHAGQGSTDLARWGWRPTVAMFSDAFGGEGKRLPPVLDALGLEASEIVFVGDTEHDRDVAAEVGCLFAVAGWNARTAGLAGDVVLAAPADVFELLADS